MICIPSLGKVNVQLVPKLVKWASEGAELAFVSVPFVDNARNVAARHFLAGKKKYLLFVDSDVLPDFDTPKRLLKARKDIVGGWYSLTMGPNSLGAIEIKPSAYLHFKDGHPLYESVAITPNTGLQRVEILSGGLTLISREVLKEMSEPWFEIKWLEPKHLSFEGEDIGFSRKARLKGFELWCDTDVFASHSKEILI